MRIEDAPMGSCEITLPWIVDPEGTRTPSLRIHQQGEDPDNDIIIPLDKDLTFGLIGDLSHIYLQLTDKEN